MPSEQTPPRRRILGLPIGGRAKTAPRKTPRLRKGLVSDVALGAAGIALGLGCAYFPWYIFLHQDEFGPRAMKFQGVDPSAPSSGVMPTTTAAVPLSATDVPILELDLFSTGTVSDSDGEGRSAESVRDQPFPSVPPPFRVVHAANGRAMIEDDTGLWIVQPGSILPDDSRVTAIEKRDKGWVVVTDGQRVLPLER